MWGRVAFDQLFLGFDVLSVLSSISQFFSRRFCLSGILVGVVQIYKGNIFIILSSCKQV